jgi:ABC-type Mn2+/Zn2+ transport system permease subunit
VSTLADILRPDFLLRDALLGSVLVGFACPLVGVYFLLRRMVFLGVALPQVSAAGIAAAFLLYSALVGPHATLGSGERLLAITGSAAFTLAATLLLALLERRGRERLEARIGATYAIAAAVTMLLLAKDPHGDAEIVGLLKGDILATTSASLQVMLMTFGAATLVLFVFRKELLLVSFDRDLAVVFGKRAGLWDVVLYVVIAAVISLGVMAAGPMATFGFLVVPPLTVRQITRRMVSFSVGSAFLGAATAFAGFYCAYRFDVPLAPAEVTVASGCLVAVAAGAALARAFGRLRRVA